YLYVADDAFFPYGGRGEAELVARVGALMGELIETHRPDLIVIACNAASTLVLPHLRTRFRVPFVGTVPAIKPACAASRTKRVARRVADLLGGAASAEPPSPPPIMFTSGRAPSAALAAALARFGIGR